MRTARIFVVVFVALALVGCGWHLRGSQSVSLDGRRIALVNDTRARPLVQAVEGVLGDLGAKTVQAETPADARLRLVGEGYSRRTLAGAGDGGIAQYELGYRLSFQVLGPEGAEWSREETVRTAESYEVNENNVLAGEARREELEGYLREQAARLMAARVQAALDQHLQDDDAPAEQR